jgi:hypothetical protein
MQITANLQSAHLLASNVLDDTIRGNGGPSMPTTKFLSEQASGYPGDSIADSMLAEDETDDLEEFPVLLQSCDVRDLIEAARNRGLSATGLARRLVRDFLRRIRGVWSANVSASDARKGLHGF